MAHAGQVGHRRDRGGLLDAHHQVVGEFAGLATGAIGDRDKRRVEGFELADGLIEVLPRRGLAGWEKLK